MHSSSKSNRLPASVQRDSFITFSELVEAVSKYVALTADALHQSRPVRDSHVRQRLLSETLSSTRLRAKHSLDALYQFTTASVAGSHQLQFNAITAIITRIEPELSDIHGTADLLNHILDSDQQLQRAIEQQLQTHLEIEEDLGQLLTIIAMMRRACSLIVNSERDAI